MDRMGGTRYTVTNDFKEDHRKPVPPHRGGAGGRSFAACPPLPAPSACHTQWGAQNEYEGGTPQESEMIQREIEATDAQIDRLVYELYGLTEEEIRVVEGR